MPPILYKKEMFNYKHAKLIEYYTFLIERYFITLQIR